MNKKAFLSLMMLIMLALTQLLDVSATRAHPMASGGTWSPTGSMTTTRGRATATLLPNGKVLVAGGFSGSGDTFGPLASAELYDPVNKSWSPTGNMINARGSHTATLLPDGKVLVSGGYKGGYKYGFLASAELYDPASGTWSLTGSMSTDRGDHTATLLPNGKVLVSGGDGFGLTRTSAELYDPASGTWSMTGSMSIDRQYHAATLLPNGKVLVSGGFSEIPDFHSLASAELYDPASGIWSTTGSMSTSLGGPTATLLLDEKVLVVESTIAELYNSVSGMWSQTGKRLTAVNYDTAALLLNGQVLTVGILGAQLYNPANGSWLSTDTMSSLREGNTETLLSNGQVLIAGGYNAGSILASAELFSPADTTPPTLHLPNTIALNATSLQGAPVHYTVTASDLDNDASQLTMTCTPSSGSIFASNTTTVQCIASDPAGNTATGSFQIIVNSEAHQIGDLIQLLRHIQQQHPLPHELELSLVHARDKLNRQNETASCQQLTGFSQQVRNLTPGSLTQNQANQLITDAVGIQSVLGCH